MYLTKSTIFFRTTRVIFFLLMVCFATEILCRAFSAEYRRDLFDYDLNGFIRHTPNYSGKIYSDKNPRGWMWVDTDNRGMRVGAKKQKYKGQRLVILLLGDSLSFGQHLNIEDTFPFYLEKALSERLGKGVEVRNCSTVAANLSELYGLGKSNCNFSDVNLTIVQPTVYDGPSPFALFYGENLGSDFQLIAFLHQCFPGKNLKNYLFVNRHGELRFDGNNDLRKAYSRYFGPWTPFYKFSHFFRKIEHNYISKIKFSCRKLKFPILYTPEAIRVYKDVVSRYNLKQNQLPSEQLAIEMFRKWSSEVGGRLLILGLPNARGLNIASNRINDPKKQFVTHVFRARSSEQLNFHSKLYKKFVQLLRAHKVHILDFVEPLSRFETNEVFLKNDIHLNSYGHLKVSEMITNYIILENMLD